MGRGLRSSADRARTLALGLAAVVLASSCTNGPQPASPSSIPLESDNAEVVDDDSVVRYGLATSPSSPWAHYRTSCDTSCGIVFGAVTDTLFATTPEGEQVAMLVNSADANADHTVHTWTLRPGIVFSDGTPFDAAAVKINIDACRHSALTGFGLAGIDDVRADGLQLTITSLAPWATLPAHFAETPCGHMFSAEWLMSLPDLPMRSVGTPFYDPVLAQRPATGDPTLPVGLGPYAVTSFSPGNGGSLLLEPNPLHWRNAEAASNQVVTVPQMELVVIEDDATRRSALAAGQFDLIHSNVAATDTPRPDAIRSVESNAFADTVHLVANDASLLEILSCRRSVARAIDHEVLVDGLGVAIATGPFPPSSLGHDAERPSPVFDASAAAQWAQRCAEDVARVVDDGGADPLATFRLVAGTDDPLVGQIGAMINDAFAETTIGGSSPALTVDVVESSAQELGLAALLGDFDLLVWQDHGDVHPDLAFESWYGEARAPVGSVAINIGRINDPTLDRALVDLRRSADRAAVVDSSAQVMRAFDANQWSTWLYWNEWTVLWGPGVNVDLERSSPEGVQLAPMINGVHTLAGVMIEAQPIGS